MLLIKQKEANNSVREQTHLFSLFTRDTRSKCNKCDGVDRILEEDEATKMTSNITNHGCVQTNHQNRYHESWIPVHHPFFFVQFHFFQSRTKILGETN